MAASRVSIEEIKIKNRPPSISQLELSVKTTLSIVLMSPERIFFQAIWIFWAGEVLTDEG